MSPTTAPDFEIFDREPAPYKVREFLEHVRSTGEPESFQGLHRGPIDRNLPFRILEKFAVDPSKRPGGDKVPCPMCQPNKFLNGSLVYVPQLQCIAAIGNCCAKKENAATAETDYRARRAEQLTEDYLLQTLPTLKRLEKRIQALRGPADEVLHAFRQFRKTAPSIHSHLRFVANKQHGQLTVTREIQSEIAATGPRGYQSGRPLTEDINFGLLQGASILRTDIQPVAKLSNAYARINPFPRSSDENAALDYIVRLSRKEMRAAEANIKAAIRDVNRTEDVLHDARSFFRPENIARLNQWGLHEDNNVQISARFSRFQGLKICALEGFHERAPIVITPFLDFVR